MLHCLRHEEFISKARNLGGKIKLIKRRRYRRCNHNTALSQIDKK